MMTVHRRIALTIAILSSEVAAQTAQDDAKVLVAKAAKAHGEGDFPTALQHLVAAYDKDPQPDLLYAIAQVHVKLERCKDAIAYYEQFLATSPSEAAANDTREAIEVCRAKLPPEPALAPPASVLPPPPLPPALPWYRDAIGAGLVGGGVVIGIVGAVVYASARGDLDDAEAAPDHATYTDLVDGAGSKRVLSVVLIGGGAALIGYGITRVVMRAPEREWRYAIAPTDGGATVSWSGAW